MENGQNDPQKDNKNKKTPLFMCIIILIAIFLLMTFVMNDDNDEDANSKQISYDIFLKLVTSNVDEEKNNTTADKTDKDVDEKKDSTVDKKDSAVDKKDNATDSKKENESTENKDADKKENASDNTTSNDIKEVKKNNLIKDVKFKEDKIYFTVTKEGNELVEKLLPEESISNESQETAFFDYLLGNLKKDENGEKRYFTVKLTDPDLVKKLEASGVTFEGENEKQGVFFSIFVSTILPLLLVGVIFIVFIKVISKGGGMMGVGKSNAKVYVEKETGVTFKDVAGQEEAKESLTELVDFLHNPGKYKEIGARLPKGALLVGPPGTGKTLLAKAVAGEAKVPFFSLSGSDFVEMFVGVGASRVRDLFKQAQQSAPCIIFIDEVDAIGKSRDSHNNSGSDEREQTLNQLLSEMDGFDTSKGLVVLAATNRPEVLDKALLRPGRFDRRVIVDKPDLKGRLDVLKVHSKDVLMDESVDLDAIALATSGAVGSDLANMINEAAILAVKSGRKYVCQADLFESVEVVIAGKEKKDRILGEEEKKIVAYHEVGHALITAVQKDAEPVQKITIVPRTMGALGYVMQVPEEEKYLMNEDEIYTRIITLLGGRAAEKVMFKSITTGASNDIEKATALARAMVTQYGMSERFGLIGLESIESKYLDGRPVLQCADQTASQIDDEVMKILKKCYDKAENIIRENTQALCEIGKFLFEKETITGKEFMEIYRRVKGIDEEEKDEEEKEEAVSESTVSLEKKMKE